MTPTEQRYPQIEEALALTWGCERFAPYLQGLKFNIQTDHKPLVPLFSTKRLEELPLRIQVLYASNALPIHHTMFQERT